MQKFPSDFLHELRENLPPWESSSRTLHMARSLVIPIARSVDSVDFRRLLSEHRPKTNEGRSRKIPPAFPSGVTK
jgi:hypothetical protein